MIDEKTMRQIRIDICNMTNGQLRDIKTHLDHEIELSERTIEEGMEVRE